MYAIAAVGARFIPALQCRYTIPPASTWPCTRSTTLGSRSARNSGSPSGTGTCSNAIPASRYVRRRSSSRSRFDARSASSCRHTTAVMPNVSRSHATSARFGYSPTTRFGRMASARGVLGRTAPPPMPYQSRRGGLLTPRTAARSCGLGLFLPALQLARRQRRIGERELVARGVDLDLAAVLQAAEEHLVGEDALHL